jgi:hypothetical protein
VYQQNFDTGTAGTNYSTTLPAGTPNNGGGGGNTAFTTVSAGTAGDVYRAVVDSGNIFGAGTTNQYLDLTDPTGATNQPFGNAPVALPAGTKGFQVEFDFFDPPTATGTGGGTRIALGSSSVSSSSQTINFIIADGTVTAFTNTVGNIKTATFDPLIMHHVVLVGNYDSAAVTYGLGDSQSVGIAKYDVWIDNVLAIDEGAFRVALTSSAGIQIGSGILNGAASTYYDNVIVDNTISFTPVPEPSMFVLAGLGLIGLAMIGKGRMK